MLEHLDTLLCLRDEETMTRTAAKLRVSQSTVSKRIAALELELGYEVVERAGRRVRLTAAGHRLVERSAPHVAALRAALDDDPGPAAGTLRLGVSESILASWGPAVLARARAAVEGLTLDLHAHRSPVAIERMRAGEYSGALVAGRHERMPDVKAIQLGEEEMVIVPCGCGPLRLRRGRRLDVMTIETHAASWASIRSGLARLRRQHGIEVRIADRLESFTAIGQMARQGWSHGLVPAGIAEALGVPLTQTCRFPGRSVRRPISLLGRPTTFERSSMHGLQDALAGCFAGRGPLGTPR